MLIGEFQVNNQHALSGESLLISSQEVEQINIAAKSIGSIVVCSAVPHKEPIYQYGQAERFNVFFPERRYGSSSWNSGLYSKIKFIIHNLKRMFKIRKELLRRRSY